MSNQFDRLAEHQLAVFKSSLYELKDQELVDYIQLAVTALEPIYDNPIISKEEAQAQAQVILTSLSYGQNGYFFVYDYLGNNIVHPKQPYRVGKNWIDLKDTAGNLVIVDLIKLAKSGGGFSSYRWEDPSTEQEAEKRSYTVPLKKWDWFVGTGIYLDEIDRQIFYQKNEFANHAKKTLLMNAALASLALISVFGSIFYMNFHELGDADEKLKKLNHEILNAQEEERSRVSRELHDSISQMLISVKYTFEHSNLILSKIKSAGNKDNILIAQKGIENGLSKLLEATQEVRRISHALRPSQLDDLGLGPALEHLCGDFSKRTGIKTTVNAPRFKGSLPAKIKISLYRVCQEALTNIEKHAKASTVLINIDNGTSEVTMDIIDDGIGIKRSKAHRMRTRAYSGLGFTNMKERIEANNGRLDLTSDQYGTKIFISIPVKYLISNLKASV